MKRKDYERPAMRVVKLQTGTPMLQVGSRKDYDMTDENPFGGGSAASRQDNDMTDENPFGGGSAASRSMGSMWDDDWSDE